MTSDFSHLLAFLPAETTPEGVETSTDLAPEDTAEPVETAAPTADLAAERVRDQARALAAQVQEYVDRLPAIQAARPVQPQASLPSLQVSGNAYIAQGALQCLSPVPAGYTVAATCSDDGDSVTVIVTVPAGVDRNSAGPKLAARLRDRGDLGEFRGRLGADPRTMYLIRTGIGGPGAAWRGHGHRAGAFHADRDGQRKVFELAKLLQKRKSDPSQRRYPRAHAWGEDSRGGTCELRLPPGMLLCQVQAAEAALRQALNAPNLTVSSRGVYPVLRLNSKQVSKEFPKLNPLRADLFVRPRTHAERHAAARDFVLPLGVRSDGTPILVRQDVSPHLGVFGGTGAGKTVFLTSIIRAAVLQGAEVICVDAKNGKDLRGVALAGLPGVVHYAAGSEAGLHRAVLYARDELARRQQLAAALQQRGVEYNPTPLLLVFDEAPAWINDRGRASNPKHVKDAAGAVVSHLSYLASQAREHRIFVLTAGQFAYVSAFAGEWKTNTSTLVILGPPSEINRQALFDGENRDTVRELGGEISKSMKGRGVVADVETGRVEMFQGFYNVPGPDADAFNIAVAGAPKLRRFAWKFPTAGEPGSDGSWQDWTPASDPSSDDLETVYLDGPDGSADPAMAIYDPTSPRYAPGVRPLRSQHQHRDSYDN